MCSDDNENVVDSVFYADFTVDGTEKNSVEDGSQDMRLIHIILHCTHLSGTGIQLWLLMVIAFT